MPRIASIIGTGCEVATVAAPHPPYAWPEIASICIHLSPGNDTLNHRIGRPRPSYLRALGKAEPPETIGVDGRTFYLREVFKHDSWAATARYGEHAESPSKSTEERTIVCKLNRQSPIGLLPMRWLGRWLARRESGFLKELAGVSGIPHVYNSIEIEGRPVAHVVAHDFVEGAPLSIAPANQIDERFFEHMDALMHELHRRNIAYVDLHKQENVIVGVDGRPHLIDFQISIKVPKLFLFRPLMSILAQCDQYHVGKHRQAHGLSNDAAKRPWIIRMHRAIAVPFRTVRRRLLVWLGVRRGEGRAASEVAPEVGLRHL